MTENLSTVREEGVLARFFDQRPVLFLLLLAVVLGFAFQGSRGLYESTEGRYTECARQSMAAGSLLEPVLNGEHHWTKPPLTYIVIAAGLKLFGENAWGARAGLAVAFVLTVLAVYFLGGLVWGRRAAPWCGLIYALSPFTLGAANAVSTDTFLALWQALAALFFWQTLRSGNLVPALLMWVAVGLGFMTKGPVAIMVLIPVIVTCVYLRRRGEKMPRVFHPLGILLFLVVGLTWYVIEIRRHPGLMDYWFFHETVGRNLYGEFNRNSEFYKPLTVYGPVLLAGSLPWSLLALWRWRAIPWPKGAWRRISAWPHSVAWAYIIAGILGPLLIFCLSTSRLALYALPLFVPITLALGKALDFLVESGAWRRRTLLRVAVVVLCVLVGAKFASSLTTSSHDMRALGALIQPVMAEYPDHKLMILEDVPLYGLQFYTGETMTPVEVEDAQEVMKEVRNTGHPHLVIVKNSKLAKIAPQMDMRVYKVREVSKNWSVIVISLPENEGGGE